MKGTILLILGVSIVGGLIYWTRTQGGHWTFVSWAETTFGADQWTLGLVGAALMGALGLGAVKFL